jgi:FMN-dependent NADH-azoreductase
MYNFSIPSQLKAWIDRLAVPGKTFRYTKNGPEGLAGGKRVVVASSCGGYSGLETPLAFLDQQETYLRGVFGFLGITDVVFIRAEGVNVGPDHGAKSIETARAEIGRLTACVARRQSEAHTYQDAAWPQQVEEGGERARGYLLGRTMRLTEYS